MRWSDKKVLVTGAGGFIGSHLSERLVGLGARVRAFLRYNSQNSRGLLEMLPLDIVKEMECFWGDLKDPFAVRKATESCHIVFHLGALIAIPYSYVNPMDFVQTNVLGTAHVLSAVLAEGVEKTILTSSSEVYGTARYVPIDEAHPLQGQSPYSASKIAADKIAESYYLSFDAPVVVIRPFNTYGPRQSARAVIPTIILQALTRPEIRLGSLHPLRDFTYVDDTVEGFLLIAESSKTIGEVINVGSGVAESIDGLAKRIMRLLGEEKQVVQDSQRVRPHKSEVEMLVADNSRALELAGWSPSVSLDEGLNRTIAWYRDRVHLFRSEEYCI